MEIGVPNDAVLLLSVGELSARKNHKVVVQALQELPENFWYVIVGKGGLREELMGLDHTGRLKMLGYRTDIVDLLHASDVFVFPSLQEGLPVALMEAMTSGLPVVCSRIRGNTDLVDEKQCLFEPMDVDGCRDAIKNVLGCNTGELGKYNQEKIMKFSTDEINRQMDKIYRLD